MQNQQQIDKKLFDAARYYGKEEVDACLSMGAKPRHIDPAWGYEPLTMAVCGNNLEAAVALMDAGVHPDMPAVPHINQQYSGASLLHYIVKTALPDDCRKIFPACIDNQAAKMAIALYEHGASLMVVENNRQVDILALAREVKSMRPFVNFVMHTKRFISRKRLSVNVYEPMCKVMGA